MQEILLFRGTNSKNFWIGGTAPYPDPLMMRGYPLLIRYLTPSTYARQVLKNSRLEPPLNAMQV